MFGYEEELQNEIEALKKENQELKLQLESYRTQSTEVKTQVESAGVRLKAMFDQWLKETKRGGSVLVGSSIKEFFEWLDEPKT